MNRFSDIVVLVAAIFVLTVLLPLGIVACIFRSDDLLAEVD